MFKNNTFLNHFLLDFSSLWPPKMEGKFIVFGISIQKPDFVKIIIFFQWKIAICLVSSFQNWNKFRCKFRSKTTSEKEALKANLGIDFGFPKPPKSTPKAMLNEACFATLWKPCGIRRKLTGLDWTAKMALHMIRSSLPIYLLICPSSP